ncbi:MAG TPA: hypothetical protein VLI65_06450, partial [Pyrinomonadaceae bacterium]|nr:hypothetical protein [Pyrinomonadaceae bacterium]
PPILPQIEQVRPKVSKEIRAETPPIIQIDRTVRTGAAERVANKPLDEDLRRTRIFGNRPPLEIQNPTPMTGVPENSTPVDQPRETRRTGAVNRPASRPVERPENTTPPIIAPRTEDKKADTPSPKEERPVERPRVEQPRTESPRRIESPKYEPPPTRTETPRNDPPTRVEPRSESPKRSEPPPQKTEPRSEPKVDKPSAPSEPRKKGDG